MNTGIKVTLVVASLLGAGAVGMALAHPGGWGYGHGMGPGMGQGYRPGMMGRGYGSGAGPGAGPMGQRHGRGMMGQGYEPGAGQMGQGCGPGMMGQGPQGSSEAGCAGGQGLDAAARLDKMKSQLGITAEQESAWKTFADQAQARMAGRQGHRQAMFALHQASSDQTPVERMQARLALMEGHLAEMRSMSEAMETLYEALTPEQQALAGQVMGKVGAGHGPGHGGQQGNWGGRHMGPRNF